MATNDAPGAEPLIFPIGHYTGAFYPTVGSLERHHRVMLGTQVMRLDDEQLTVWLLARGLPDKIDDTPWTRTVLEAEATAAGVKQAPRIVAGLVTDGLIAETVVGSEHSLDFAESYRLVPLMLGLGNTPEEPWLHGIGFLDQPVLKVAGEVYSMWEWAHVDNNLWAACHSHADTARRAGASDPDETVPERILTGFLGAVHPLLTASAAYLDLAWLDERTEQPA
ncbi:MAG: hypothetical protein ACRDT6_18935 [Micromonosporaceae bacterium]